MATYKITSDRPGEPTMYMCSTSTIPADATLNAELPNAEAGTIVHTAGYTAAKQKGIDESWVDMLN